MKTKLLSILIPLGLILGSWIFFSLFSEGATKASPPPPDGAISTDLRKDYSYQGIVRSREPVEIYSPRSGLLSNLNISYGNKLNNGDIPLKISKEDTEFLDETIKNEIDELESWIRISYPAEHKALNLKVENLSLAISSAETEFHRKLEILDRAKNNDIISLSEYTRDIDSLNVKLSDVKTSKDLLDMEIMTLEKKRERLENSLIENTKKLKKRKKFTSDLGIVIQHSGVIVSVSKKFLRGDAFAVEKGEYLFSILDQEGTYIFVPVTINEIAGFLDTDSWQCWGVDEYELDCQFSSLIFNPIKHTYTAVYQLKKDHQNTLDLQIGDKVFLRPTI